MEETYAFRGAYLVDTSKLGNGRRKDDDATVRKLPFPKYLRGLEGLAFVPDLTDDEHLGTLFLGSQRGRIIACKLPLAHLDGTEVECGDEIRYPYGIDSMEYDPTFEVVPGKFGALVIGSDPRRDAVYVDPWALAKGRLETWSDRFRMASGRIGGVELKGREGHAIYGDKAFYALDESRDGNYGAIVCRIENKPKSRAKSVSGWHIPEPSSDKPALIQPPSSSGSSPSIDGDSMEVTIQGSPNNGALPEFPESFDIMMYNVTPAMVASQWMLHSTVGDGKCGRKCENEKAMMSMLYPRLALQLRCHDRLSGQQDQRHAGMDPVCDDDAQMGTDELVTLSALPDSSIIDIWMETSSGGCDEACAHRKDAICKAHPELGKQLKCDDLRKGRDTLGMKWKDCKNTPKPKPLPDSPPVSFSYSQTTKRWDAHGARECGPACQVDKRLMCLSRPRLCWKLRCQDIELGLDSPVIDCQKKPPSLPEKIDHPVHSAPGYCTFTEVCDGEWAGTSSNGWCNAGMGNCAVSCRGMWCFMGSDNLQPIKIVKAAAAASPSSTNDDDDGLKKPAIGPSSSSPASPGPDEKRKRRPATAGPQTPDASSSAPAVPKWTWKAPSSQTEPPPSAPSSAPSVPKWTWSAPSPKTAPPPSASSAPAVPKWTWKALSPKTAADPLAMPSAPPSPEVPRRTWSAPSPKTAPPPSAPAALSAQAEEMSTIVEVPADNAASSKRPTKRKQDGDASSQTTSELTSSIPQSPIVWIERASDTGISVYTPRDPPSNSTTSQSNAAESLSNETVSQSDLAVVEMPMDSPGILPQEEAVSGDAHLDGDAIPMDSPGILPQEEAVSGDAHLDGDAIPMDSPGTLPQEEDVSDDAQPEVEAKLLDKHHSSEPNQAEALPIVPPLTSQADALSQEQATSGDAQPVVESKRLGKRSEPNQAEALPLAMPFKISADGAKPPVISGNSLLPDGTGNGRAQSRGDRQKKKKEKEEQKKKKKKQRKKNMK